MSSSQIHARAVEVARKYRACEVELIEALQEVDRLKVYLHHGFNSLFKYACDCLGLSEDVAYIFINVSRKAIQVPELAKEIREGRLTIAKAKRIVPILNSTNKTEVLTFAAKASKREIEKRVAQEAPTFAIHDKLSFTADPIDKVTLKRNVEHRREVRRSATSWCFGRFDGRTSPRAGSDFSKEAALGWIGRCFIDFS